MADRKGKRTVIDISSSSDEEEEEEVQSEDEDDDDDDYGKSVSISSDDDEEKDSDDQEEDSGKEEDVDGDGEDDDDDESLCNRVIRLLKEGNDLQAVTLRECKAYLRKHELRITGTKVVCVQRIKEHWRIKGGHSEALYPRSSFFINCTGDVCKGDIVLFTQKVYEKFDKITRGGGGRVVGKRTIAGRVVKESYGAANQQHTFTVEILWSKGVKKLPTLFPLLVKGRNLYKMKTFRQRWNNEAERTKVLAEKHKRGQAARLLRSMKRAAKASYGNGGAKRQKKVHHTEPPRSRQTTEVLRRQCASGCRKAPSLGHDALNNHRQLPNGQRKLKQTEKSRAPKSTQRQHKHGQYKKDRGDQLHSHFNPPQNPYESRMDSKQTEKSRAPKSTQRQHKHGQYKKDRGDQLHSHFNPPQNPYESRMDSHDRNASFRLPNHEMSSISTTIRLPHFQPRRDPPRDYYRSQVDFNNRNTSFGFPNNEMNSTSTMMRYPPYRPYADSSMRLPSFRPYSESSMLPTPQHQGFRTTDYYHHSNSGPRYEFNPGIHRFP